MNVRLTHALYMGFSIIIVTTLVLAFIVWSLVNKSATISTEIEADDVPGVLAYLNVLDEIGDLQTNALEYLNGEADEHGSFKEKCQRVPILLFSTQTARISESIGHRKKWIVSCLSPMTTFNA
ncbi:hypothetical protein QW180_16875 [Vibrio sinaloensis]|nr:hypothetical protein [Vibrio sinaloensis]